MHSFDFLCLQEKGPNTHTHTPKKNIIKISRSLTHPPDCVVYVFCVPLRTQQATGYPLAYVAAKLALGHDLVQLRLGTHGKIHERDPKPRSKTTTNKKQLKGLKAAFQKSEICFW